MLKKILLIVGILVVLLIVAVVCLGVWAYKNPLALYERTTRSGIAKAGFERMSMEAPAGELVWFEAGEGPELVILHGAGDQAGAWYAVAPTLTDEYRVSVLDLPGHGDSDPLEGPLKLTTIIEGAAAFLESREGKGPVILVGHSMGGWVSMRLAEMMPERIERIILVNGHSIRWEGGLILLPADLEEGRKLFEVLRDPSSDPIPDWVIADYVQNAPTSPIGRISAEIEDLESHLMDGRLHEVLIPVDVMWGASDMLIPVEHARKFRAELPNARLTLVPECGHHPANECPVEFARLLDEVLESEP